MMKKTFSNIKSMRFFIGISFFVLVIALVTFYSQIVQSSYKKKSTELRISYVQSQSNILATQLLASNFVLYGENTKDLEAEIDQLASVLEGRVIVIDYNYRVIKDTYTIQQGKYILSEDVFQIMRSGNYAPYEIKNNYIKVFTPIKSSSGGECRGVISFAPEGENGFGYDPVFVVPQIGKTFAQMTAEEKNAISHRGRALTLFKEYMETK